MRPKIFTFRNFLLSLVALGLVIGLVNWARLGFPLPGGGVESTRDKIAFVSDRDGQKDIYLMDSETGQKTTRLTNDKAEESELAFSQDGQQLTFTSDHGGSTRQVSLMYAGAGQRNVALTNTSASKEQPHFVNGDIYHLDAGKITAIAADASRSRAIFPDVEDKRPEGVMASLFATGGIRSFTVKPDGSQILAVINQEDKKLLVVFVPEEDALALLGVANHINVSYTSKGEVIACLSGEIRLGNQPLVLYNSELAKKPGYQIPEITEMFLTQAQFQSPPDEQDNILLRFDKDYKIQGAVPLVLNPDAILPSPDGDRIAIWKELETTVGVADPNNPAKNITQKIPAGLMVLSFNEGSPQMLPLYDKPCRDVTWSPDSKQLVFVSGGDIYRISVNKSENNPNQATNLTSGKGINSSPTWSPVGSSASK